MVPKAFKQVKQQVDIVGKGRGDHGGSSWKMFSVFSRRNLPPPAMSMHLCTPLSYIMTPYWDARLTIASFSAELPVIRGHGRSPASSCLFVRDQKSAYASHFRPCWP